MRLRSANTSNANNTWNVNSTGYLNNNNANNANRALPDCVVKNGSKRSAHSADNGRGTTQGAEVRAAAMRRKTAARRRLPAGRYDYQRAALFKDMDEEEIIGYEALWNSMMKCKRGVMWKDSVASFVLNGLTSVSKLEDELKSGTYQERPHKYFRITSPKPREIMSQSFRDRVYQRSLNDVAVYPEMIRHFIYDNAACQKGKGTDFARDRLVCHLQRHYRKHGTNGYILKMDIRGYYPNMRHDRAKDCFKKYLVPDVYKRVEDVIDSFAGEVGFNPGSQIIQIAGISMLNWIDHFVKERLCVKHYLRYMDDMIVIGADVAELTHIRCEVERQLAKLGFTLHNEKTFIIPVTKGFLFLGFRYVLTTTGKVLRFVDYSRVSAERRKLARMAGKVRRSEMTMAKMDQCFQSWLAHASKGNNHGLVRNMKRYYKQLQEV